jgi:flagellar motor switch protein FliM
MYNKIDSKKQEVRVPDHYESLGGYGGQRLRRNITPIEVSYAKDVFDRILDEMRDSPNTSAMFEPFAKVANFVLANRMIRLQVAENQEET